MAVSKADLALTFAVELRNKVLDAYQEINRTQI
jgi:flagellar hook-basal body complex protein FliE